MEKRIEAHHTFHFNPKGASEFGNQFHCFDKQSDFQFSTDKVTGEWLELTLKQLADLNTKPITLGELKANYEKQAGSFEKFWSSENGEVLRGFGLLIL